MTTHRTVALLEEFPVLLVAKGPAAPAWARRKVARAFRQAWESLDAHQRYCAVESWKRGRSLESSADWATYGHKQGDVSPVYVAFLEEHELDEEAGVEYGRTCYSIALDPSLLKLTASNPGLELTFYKWLVSVGTWYQAPALLVLEYDPPHLKDLAQKCVDQTWTLLDLIEASGGCVGKNRRLLDGMTETRLAEMFLWLQTDAHWSLLELVEQKLFFPAMRKKVGSTKGHKITLRAMDPGICEEAGITWPNLSEEPPLS